MAYRTLTPIQYGGKRYEVGAIVDLPAAVAQRSLRRGDVIVAESPAPPVAITERTPPEPEKLDINTAAPTALTRIPGIGRATADKILEARPISNWDEFAELFPHVDLVVVREAAEIR